MSTTDTCQISSSIPLYFTTFGSSSWSAALDRMQRDIDRIQSDLGVFSGSFILGEKDLPADYLDIFSKYDTDRGFAYFSWKPFVVRHVLNMIQKDSVLLYLDAGCVFPETRIRDFIDELQDHVFEFYRSSYDIGLTTFETPETCPVASIIRKEILDEFGLADDNKFLFSFPHYQAGLMLLRNSEWTYSFLSDWYSFFTEHYDLIRHPYTDRVGQLSRFVHNGSDQAVMQCMLYRTDTRVFDIDFMHNYGVIAHKKD